MKVKIKVYKGATTLIVLQRDKETRFNDVKLRYNLYLEHIQSVLFKITP